MQETTEPIVAYEWWSDEHRADPYPLYRRMQQEAPVYWSGYGWTLSRHADVLAVLLDPRASADRMDLGGLPEDARRHLAVYERTVNNMMLFQDPPDHTRLRGLVTQAFSAKRIEDMRPRIQMLVDELLDAVVARGDGRMDVIADVANPLPAIVIAEMLGVPAEDREQFKAWATDFAISIDGLGEAMTILNQGLASVLAMSEYLGRIARQRRDDPRDDLISALPAAEEAGEKLNHDEFVATCLLLLVAGNETTTNLIGNGILTLLRHPDALARLRADPALIRTAVEELLRFESPIQGTSRLAIAPIAIDGHTIEPGHHISVLTGAANRDSAQFDDPERLDLARRPNRHIAFAHGMHFCLGAPLARAQGQIAINAIVQRFPHLAPVSDEVEWRSMAVFRGLTALPVDV